MPTEINRRHVLKSTGGLAMTPMLLNEVEATESPPDIGSTHLVESTLVYEDVDHVDNHLDKYELPYVVEPEKGRATLVNAPVSEFNREFVSAHGHEFGESGQLHTRSSGQSITVRDSLDHPGKEFAKLAGEYSPPSFSVQRQGQTVNVESDGERLSVPVGEQRTLRLPGRQVEWSDGTTDTITPVIRTRNHGTLDVYGRQNRRVFPLDTEVPWAKIRVNYYLSIAGESSNVSVKKAGDFLIVNVK